MARGQQKIQSQQKAAEKAAKLKKAVRSVNMPWFFLCKINIYSNHTNFWVEMTLRMVARVQVRKEKERCEKEKGAMREKEKKRESESRMDEENTLKGNEEQLDGMEA